MVRQELAARLGRQPRNGGVRVSRCRVHLHVLIDSDQVRGARHHVTLCLIIALQGENIMTRNAKLLGVIVTAALFTAAPLSLHYSPAKVLSVSLDRAQARVGRPLTPMSVAGVNRRVHRRAYYGAAAAGAAAAGAAAYGAYH